MAWRELSRDPGYVQIICRGYSIESSLVIGVGLIVGASLALKVLIGLLLFPFRALSRRSRRAARRRLAEGVLAAHHGQHARASIHDNFPPPSFPCQVVEELESHYATVRLSDFEWYTFRPILVNVASSFGSCYADVAYELADGVTVGATLDVIGNTTVVHLSGTTELMDERTLLPYEPSELLLTTPDGRMITLSQGVGITEIGDLDGNTLSFGSGGIVHSSGRAVTFERDAEGRITRITTPNGDELGYGVDHRWRMVSSELPSSVRCRPSPGRHMGQTSST